ncbi:hypothetical protein [Streptomyces sp. 7-21]|uniref:hypothetical protein n=1 Tax=Streptomyces sp. 7-21 TaxID=2802283 RepID=UPI0019202EBD|nr:hypothetical protein [Streptomyces sp. 7-21]MBL1067756.1 hypothetical protein [Streptomyces sp. 7-21]
MHADIRKTLPTVLAAALAALCGLAGPAAPPAGAAGPHRGDEPVTDRRLRDALLDAVDFPAGWASESPESAHKRGTGVPLPEEDACRRLFDHDGKARAARAAFARTRTGPFVTTVVTGYDEPADARRALRAFREAARECDTFHAEEGPADSSATVTYEAAQREASGVLSGAAELGEESAAVRYERKREGQATTPVLADAVIVRVGSYLVRVAQTGPDGPEAGGLADIAERAVEKLEQVTRGATPSPDPDQPGTTKL